MSFLDFLHFSRMHSDYSWDSNFLSVPRVEENITSLKRSLVDSDVRELTILARFEFECQADER